MSITTVASQSSKVSNASELSDLQPPPATSSLVNFRNHLTNKAALTTAIVGVTIGAAAQQSKGIATHYAWQEPNAIQYGAEKFEGIAVWYKGLTRNGDPIVMQGTLYDSTTVIVTAHGTSESGFFQGTITTVGTSLDYNQPTTGQVANVASVELHPSYDGINYDFAKIKLATPIDLSQFPNRPNGPLVIGSLQPGDIMSFGGYGRGGSVELGEKAQDGLLKGGDLRVVENGSMLFDSSFNNAGLFSLANGPLPLEALTRNLDSGSPTLNGLGQWVGPIVGGTSSLSHEAYSYVGIAARDDVQNWIVPEPGGVMVLALGGLALRRRRHIV